MKKTRTITKKFYTNNLTDKKYFFLYFLAVQLRDRRNEASRYLHTHFLEYMLLPMSDSAKRTKFVYDMYNLFPRISSYTDQQLYADVFDTYLKRGELICDRLTFVNKKFIKFELYTKNTKEHKKGDLKRVVYQNIYNDLTKTLSYLARNCHNEQLLDYIYTQIKSDKLESNLKRFYENVIKYIDKFGYEKLMRIALQRRDVMIKRYNKEAINFKSLSFRGYCCYEWSDFKHNKKGDIITDENNKRIKEKKIFLSYNKHYDSPINTFITLSIPLADESEILHLPVKYSKDYHFDLKYWEGKKKKYIFYRILFDELNREIIIDLTAEQDVDMPENKKEFEGIDVNIKHNMFMTSSGISIDYDRELIKDIIAVKNRCQKALEQTSEHIKKQNAKKLEDFAKGKINKMPELKSAHLGKKKQRMLDSSKRRMDGMLDDKCVDLIKRVKASGKNHLVMENLDGSFTKGKGKNDEFDENYNFLVRCVNLSSIKNRIEDMIWHYDMQLSTVCPENTSNMCPECGCIHPLNRQSQEEFFCIHCEHSDNADHNAAVNIANRVSVTVLSKMLLKQLPEGNFEPKKLNHSYVKERLLEYSAQAMKEFDSKRASCPETTSSSLEHTLSELSV